MRSLLLAICFLFTLLGAQEPAPPAAPTDAAKLDKGHLDPTWFNLPATAFGPHDLADHGWVKPGFKLGGRSLKVVWEAPRWTEPNTDEDNLAAAEAHRTNFPAYLRENLESVAGLKASLESGDLLLVGRLVECNAKGGLMAFGWEAIVYDLKLVDPVSGETLVALHNRLLGGNGWKGNGSRKRFLAWSKDFAKHAKANWLP